MVKDDWPPPRYCRPEYHLKCFIFRFSLDMVKDDWTLPRYCRPEYHLKCFKFRFSLNMVKDDWTLPRYCRPEYHLKLFILKFRLDMVKDDWTPPRYCRPETHLIFLYIQILPGNGERWLNSTQVLQTRNSSNIFVHSDLACTRLKMIELHPGTADQKLP